jgi:hypothetical protein
MCETMSLYDHDQLIFNTTHLLDPVEYCFVTPAFSEQIPVR